MKDKVLMKISLHVFRDKCWHPNVTLVAAMQREMHGSALSAPIPLGSREKDIRYALHGGHVTRDVLCISHSKARKMFLLFRKGSLRAGAKRRFEHCLSVRPSVRVLSVSCLTTPAYRIVSSELSNCI